MFGRKKRFPLPYIYRDKGNGLHYLLMLTSLSGKKRFLGKNGVYYSNPRDSRAWHEYHDYTIQYVVLYRDTLCHLSDYRSLFEYTPSGYKKPDFKIGAPVKDVGVLVPDDCIDFERFDEWEEDFWSRF